MVLKNTSRWVCPLDGTGSVGAELQALQVAPLQGPDKSIPLDAILRPKGVINPSAWGASTMAPDFTQRLTWMSASGPERIPNRHQTKNGKNKRNIH